ncbi:MAG: acetylxylan esterase, partial [Terracidiphilus sp.]
MRLKNLLPFLFLPAAVLMLQAQAPPPTGAPANPAQATAPPTPAASARAPHAPPSVVAGIPVNYDQAKVGTYTLPDPLLLNNGKMVRNAKTWWTKRRPEIVRIFETQQYGIAPGRPGDENFKVVEKGSASDGKALREQVTISLSNDPAWPKIHLLIYLPAAAKKPVPMYFTISFAPNQCVTDDPAIIPGEIWSARTQTRVMPPKRYCFFGHVPVERLLDAGYGVASFYYGDVDPDYLAGFKNGIRAHYLPASQTERAPDAWGSIAAWAWGMSRVEDYF